MLAPQTPEAVLRRLEWSVLRRLEGLLQGDYRGLSRGQGVDLADLREYQYYDDVRHIDWNVTARLDQPHVRIYLEDREVTAWFLLDVSPSIDFESVSVSKRMVLTEFASVLCRLLVGKGNRAGAILFSGGVDRVIPARGGRLQVLHILDALMKYRAPRKGGATNLARALAEAGRIIRRRSLVFVVSDFITENDWEKSLGQLAMRHDVVAVRLLDPLEVHMPDIGLLTFQDLENGEQIFVDTHDTGFRRRFAALAEAREEAMRAAFARAGVDALELSTEDDLADAIFRFAEMRRRRFVSRGAAPEPMAS